MTTYSWLQATSADWATASAWSPTGPVNAATADAVIGLAGGYAVSIAAGATFLANTVAMAASGATLAVAGTLSLGGAQSLLTLSAGTVALTGAISGGTVALAGGVLASAGGALTGALAMTGGTLSVAAGAGLALSGASFAEAVVVGPGTLTTSGLTTLGGSYLDFDGGIAWVNTGVVRDNVAQVYDGLNSPSGQAFSVTNAAGGTFDIATAAALFYDGGNGNPVSFANAGLLVMTGGASATMYAALANTGTVTATNGTLYLLGGGSLAGSAGGTTGGGTAGLVQINSAMATAGALTVLDAGARQGLEVGFGATWTDSGVIDARGGILLGDGAGTGPAAIVITAAGRLNLATDNASLMKGGAEIVVNNGVLAKTGGAGVSQVQGTVTNVGTLDAASGTLKLAAFIGGAGRMQIEAGATLELANGTVGATNTIVFNGAGATLRLDANSSVARAMPGFGAGSRIDLPAAAGATAAISGATLTIAPSVGAALTFVAAASLAGLRPGIARDAVGGSIVTLYGVASAVTHAPEPVAFGARHVGDAASQAVSVSNGAPAFSENLDATLSAAAIGFTATGAVAGLAPGATGAGTMRVTLDTSQPGAVAGVATLALFSNGAGLDGAGQTPLAAQTVNVTGAVYGYATPAFGAASVALGAARVGGAALAGSVTLGNGAASAFRERLVYQLGAAPAALSVSNAAGTIAAGGGVTIGLSLSTATAGDFTGIALGAGGAGAAFVSSGAGTSGLADTALAAPTLTVGGQVYAPARVAASGTVVSFGVVHVGDAVAPATLAISNTGAGALVDVLQQGAISRAGGYAGAVAGLASSLAAGASGTVSFGLATSSAGAQSGTVSLGFASHDSALADLALAPVVVSVSGTVNNYATAAIKALAGGALGGAGGQLTLNLGTIQQGGAAASVTLGVTNAATGVADALAGSFTLTGAGFVNTGFAAFTGLAAGAASANDVITLPSNVAGAFTETIVLRATGSNASGYAGALPAQTITVTGVVAAPTIGPTYVLTPAPTTIVATIPNATFVATGGVLTTRHSLTGAPGANKLVLSGGGVFDLGAPKALANIQTVTATEGQAASGAIAGTMPYVFLRDGVSVALNVASAATLNPANPNPAGIVVYGAADSSRITLGNGADTVVLGSATEQVFGGGGATLVQATAAFASARVSGAATGRTTLEVTTGGTIALNANTSRVTVQLDQPSTLKLNAVAGIVAIGQKPGNVIAAGVAGQTIGGLAGGDTLVGTAGFGDIFAGLAAGLNGDILRGFGGGATGSDSIAVTDLSPGATLRYAGTATQGTLSLDDGAHRASLTLVGNYAQSRFHIAGDGHAGSVITYG